MTDADTRTGATGAIGVTSAIGTAEPGRADDGLRERVEALVVIATGRVVSADDLRGAGGSLVEAGVNSIAYINLLEALERLYGVELDTERDPEALATVDGIVRLVRAAGRGGDGTPA
ncbi:phosphopantetheine-binding protein [Actinoallomurus sp. NPDC050550]|uniref:phosphopantetheine-binding protein n=1 Tax=Actinoallomurus sp. NPDC050550 TaxID=3154937 RepID=UPI0033CD2EE4